MDAHYGFHAVMTARPGHGDALVALLLEATAPGGPAANEHCQVYLVARSASTPERVHVTEGWTSKAAHAENFARPQSQAFVGRIAALVEGQAEYHDVVPQGGMLRGQGAR